MNYPTKQRYWMFEALWSMPFGLALCLLFGSFVLTNLLFGFVEWYFAILNNIDPKTKATVTRTFGEYIYFGFITGLTIGYGDYTPFGGVGKALVVAHGLSSALVFSVATALSAAKALSPRNVVVFSKKLILDKKKRRLYFRIMNIHRSRLLNLQVRVAATQHAWGNVIAGVCPLDTSVMPPWIGSHDFTVDFEALDNESGFDLTREWEAAVTHDKEPETQTGSRPRSRFKVEVLILGTYRTQSYVQEKRYQAGDIEEGVSFAAIQYNEEDQRRVRPIRYRRFSEFWAQFNRILRQDR